MEFLIAAIKAFVWCCMFVAWMIVASLCAASYGVGGAILSVIGGAAMCGIVLIVGKKIGVVG